MLPGAGVEFSELTYSGYVGVQPAVHINNLAGYIIAFVGSQIYAHVTYIFRASIAVNGNVVKENILKSLRNTCFILRSNNKTGSYAVAANLLLAILKGRVLSKHVDPCFCTGVSGGTQISAA